MWQNGDGLHVSDSERLTTLKTTGKAKFNLAYTSTDVIWDSKTRFV